MFRWLWLSSLSSKGYVCSICLAFVSSHVSVLGEVPLERLHFHGVWMSFFIGNSVVYISKACGPFSGSPCRVMKSLILGLTVWRVRQQRQECLGAELEVTRWRFWAAAITPGDWLLLSYKVC